MTILKKAWSYIALTTKYSYWIIMILELKNATIETIKEMIKHKFKLSEEEILKYEDYFSSIKYKEVSPAKVQNECFKYSEAEEVLIALCK